MKKLFIVILMFVSVYATAKQNSSLCLDGIPMKGFHEDDLHLILEKRGIKYTDNNGITHYNFKVNDYYYYASRDCNSNNIYFTFTGTYVRYPDCGVIDGSVCDISYTDKVKAFNECYASLKLLHNLKSITISIPAVPYSREVDIDEASITDNLLKVENCDTGKTQADVKARFVTKNTKYNIELVFHKFYGDTWININYFRNKD